MRKDLKTILAILIFGIFVFNTNLVFADDMRIVKISLNKDVANVNGEDVALSNKPYVQEPSQSMMIPLRFVSTALGIPDESIKYNQETKRIDINFNNKNIGFVAGTDNMFIDDENYNMMTQSLGNECPIYTEIKNGSTYIPLRALETGFGIDINWEPSTKTAILINNVDTKPLEKTKMNVEDEYMKQQKNNGYPILSKEERRKVEEEIVRLTNIEREKVGVPPVQIDEKLMSIAEEKSQDMADNNYFNHISPNLGAPADVVDKNHIDYNIVCENISAGQKTPEAVVQAWLNSETHRKNLLNPELKYIGVGMGISDNSKFHYYWTQQFIG